MRDIVGWAFFMDAQQCERKGPCFFGSDSGNA